MKLTITLLIFKLIFFPTLLAQHLSLSPSEFQAVKNKYLQNEEPWKTAVNGIITQADRVKNRTHSWSEAPYSVTFQGSSSRYFDDDDGTVSWRFTSGVFYLSMAYAFTGNTSYADEAIHLINVWCLDEETGMIPEYTTVFSRIDLNWRFLALLSGVSYLQYYDGWNDEDKNSLFNWLTNLASDGIIKHIESGSTNRTIVWTSFIAGVGALTDNPLLRSWAFGKYISDFNSQVREDGIMYKELSRTNALQYSMMSIDALIYTAEIGRHYGLDLWNYTTDDGRDLKLVLDTYAPYIIDPSTWPYNNYSPSYSGTNVGVFRTGYMLNQNSQYLNAFNQWASSSSWTSAGLGISTATHSIGAYDFDVPSIEYPEIMITTPQNQSAFSEGQGIEFEVSITKSSSDAVISRVEYYRQIDYIGENGSAFKKMGYSESSPYNFVWNNAPQGNHAIKAVAIENSGKSAASSDINIGVSAQYDDPIVENDKITIFPIADSFVHAGASPNPSTNYGSEEYLQVQWRGHTSSSTRRTFLKFKLNDLNIEVDDVETVTLRLYPSYVQTSGMNNELYWWHSNNWEEPFITWSNQPPPGTLSDHQNRKLASWTPVQGQFVEIDITDHITSNFPDQEVFTFIVEGGYSNDARDATRYPSREYGDAQYRPQLIVNVENGLNVSITQPQSGDVFYLNEDIEIKVNVLAPDGDISKVEFFNNNNKIGERTESPYTFVWQDAPNGSHSLTAKVLTTSNESAVSAPVDITVTEPGNEALNIHLDTGWNMVSSYIDPDNPQLEDLMDQLGDKLRKMKNGDHLYWPEMETNTIGAWSSESGYQINMYEPATLSINGTIVDPESTPVSLVENWNLISYLRTTEMPIADALGSIVDDMVVVKTTKDNVAYHYWPAQGFNDIGDMKPGVAYQVFMSNSATLYYPANNGTSKSGLKIAGDYIQSQPTAYFELPAFNTGSNATLLVSGDQLGKFDEVGVFTGSGELIGAASVQNNRALVTVWGKDTQCESDCFGAEYNESLSIVAFSREDYREEALSVSKIEDVLRGRTLSGVLSYERDAIWVADVFGETGMPRNYVLEQNYPNPFNPGTVIRYSIPKETNVQLSVYNMLGQKVVTLVEREQVAGSYQVQFDGSGLSSGVYIYHLRAGDFSEVRKMVLLR